MAVPWPSTNARHAHSGAGDEIGCRMRIGLVVDSACDLPQQFIEQYKIHLLPITVRIGDAVVADQRDEAVTLAFLNSHVESRGYEAETQAFSVEQIRHLFLERLVTEYDHVFCLTIASTRSAIFDNATQASFSILNDYKPHRQAAGIQTPFSMRVMDTQILFTGQGVSAIEAARLIEAGETPAKIRARLERVIANTHLYLCPRDLFYLRSRGKNRGDRSVSLLSAALGSAMDIKPVLHGNQGHTEPVARIKGFDQAVLRTFSFVEQRIHAGLLTAVVCLSYGGELQEMRALPGYVGFRQTCAQYGIEVLESIMSLTGMVNVGKGALGIAYASENNPRFA